MKKLWQKNPEGLDPLVERFETENDLLLDHKLTKFDVYGSLAHAYMLTKIGIISSEEFGTLSNSLKRILDLDENGSFKLKFGDEDNHTKIENFLINDVGSLGGKIHTARSRNDQVLLNLRLFAKESLLEVWGQTLQFASVLNSLSQKFEEIPMPGYTHMQKAMPSSVGMWFGAYAESALDNVQLIKTSFELNNQSPLGSAASYGVPLPIDRKLVCGLLGFEKVQNNSLYCQNSRGKIESIIMFALLQTTLDISKMASDIMIFTTSEFNFFDVNKSFTSGSSIMPQKKNVDIAELLRSKVHVIESYLAQIIGITKNLPSGYNRDSQDTKKPFIEGLDLTNKVIEMAILLAKNITPKKDVLKKAMTKDLYATEKAYKLVKQGMPFRQAYLEISQNLDSINDIEPIKSLKVSSHIGGTGNLNTKSVIKQLSLEKKLFAAQKEKYQKAITNILSLK